MPLPTKSLTSKAATSKASSLERLRREEDQLIQESDAIRRMLSQLEAHDAHLDEPLSKFKKQVHSQSGTIDLLRDRGDENRSDNHGEGAGVILPESDISCFKQAAI